MFIKLDANNFITDICPYNQDGYIDAPSVTDIVGLFSLNGKYRFKYIEDKMVLAQESEQWELNEYIAMRTEHAKTLTYASLSKTDYIEIRECDPDEPNKLPKAELKLIRSARRDIRSNFRQLETDMTAAKTHAECDLIYRTWEATYYATNNP